MNVQLVYFSNVGGKKSFPLSKRRTTVGRKPGCDLQIPLIEVSREHCQFVKQKTTVVLRDLDSANGTYVNSKRVKEVSLGAGDQVSIGTVVFMVQIDGKPEKLQVKSDDLRKAAGVIAKPTAKRLGKRGSDAETSIGIQISGAKDENLDEDILGDSFFADFEDEEDEDEDAL